MIDEVEKIHGPVFMQPRINKERLYHNALSKLSFYPQIKHHLTFSIRSQKRGDYTSISHKAGMETFQEIVAFIINDLNTQNS